MEILKNPDVARVFDAYPKIIRKKLLYVRQLILESAAESAGVNRLEETLKWGAPSYLTGIGSTIRVGWKESVPDQYALYFHCQTSLVSTFKALYGDLFKFEGDRAIIFGENDEISIDELKHCISLSLTYHRIKHLPMLGA